MYPKNAASPQRVAIGAVVQISDGAVQTSGVSVKVMPQGGAASAGGGTIAYEEGIVHYVPTQAETNYASFMLIAYKTSCIPVAVTIVTTISSTAGHAGIDWANVIAPTTTINLSGTTIKTATDVETDTADIQTRLPAALVSGRMDSSTGAMAANVITAAAINDGAIDAATFASGALDAVWSTAARTLTAIDEDSTTLDLDATIRAAVGLAAANLDTQLDALPTAAEVTSAVWAAAARTLTAIDEDSTTLDLDATIRAAVGLAAADLDSQLGALPTASENAAALLAAAVEGAVTVIQSMRLWNAAMGGKASGLETTNPKYRNLGDSKDRIDATVDADGNRSAVTLDLT